MNDEEFRARFPNASGDFFRLNPQAGEADIQPDSAGKAPKLERHAGDGGVGALQVQKKLGQRFLVRVTAIRTRLLDEDNLCEKFHVDLLRYASGGLFGDEAGTTKIEVCQEKAQGGEAERVLLEVFEI